MKPQRQSAHKALEILLVEDSPTQAAQLQHFLKGQGYKVRVAANGKEALAAVRKRKPSMVISDIVMPEMDGYTLCKEIKSRRNLKEIPVVLLTALSEPKDVIQALQCGADSFIRKPFEERYLLSRVEYILTNREMRKNEKVRMGLEVYLFGQRHFITSERQQIFDMLISTYDEAVHINSELAESQKDLRRSYHSLHGLYRIAEGLNQSTSEQEVLDKALERSLELPGIQAGWISLRTDESGFRIAATRDLPPALTTPGAFEGDCLCRRKLLRGELDQAANILECERLQKASCGTNGLRYHASVPLQGARETLGLLNLASTDQGLFRDEDLKTLDAVGQQIGLAIERARLYEQLEKKVEERTAALRAEITERKRAEDEARRNLARIRALHEIDLAITSTLDLNAVLYVLLENIERFLPYSSVSEIRLLNQETGFLEPVASLNVSLEEWKTGMRSSRIDFASEIMEKKAPLVIPNIQTDPRSRQVSLFRRHGLVSFLGVPMMAKDEFLGLLGYFTKERHLFTDEEVEFLSTLAGQAAIAIHNAQLYEETRKQATDLRAANEGLQRREQTQTLLKEINQDSMTLDLNGLLQKLTDKVRDFLQVDISDIRIMEPDGSRPIAASGAGLEELQGRQGGESDRRTWFMGTSRPLVIPDTTTTQVNATSSIARLTIRGYLGAPLFLRNGNLVGVLRALTYQPRHFSQEEIDLLEQLANGAAIAIENARLYQDLEKSNNVKTEFLSVMSHELRTPLNVIMGYTTMMFEGILGEIEPQQKQALYKVSRQSKDLLSMVESIMEATKIESESVVIEKQEVNLTNFLSDLRSSYDVPLEKDVCVLWDFPSDLPLIKTDSLKLAHIVQNLIHNAIKFTEQGTVTICARVAERATQRAKSTAQGPECKERSAEGKEQRAGSTNQDSEKTPALLSALSDMTSYVEFTVTDTGIGIPEKDLLVIFDMFRQVDSSDTRLYGGVGLGLYIVKKFTELLGGTVEVESEEGKGSAFTVTIPYGQAQKITTQSR